MTESQKYIFTHALYSCSYTQLMGGGHLIPPRAINHIYIILTPTPFVGLILACKNFGCAREQTTYTVVYSGKMCMHGMGARFIYST